MTSFLELRDVGKVFRTEYVETHALRSIDVSIALGEYIAVIGPSGSGKSTLMHVLGLLSPPTQGQYIFAGTDVTSLSWNERAALRNVSIGFVFQNFNLVEELDVLQNVELPFRIGRRPIPGDHIADCLEMLKIDHRKHHFPNQLSGGQQQRVAIARALVTKPQLILLDEPTGNLDSAASDTLLAVLDSVRSSSTSIVMVTHETKCAERADRVLTMRDGQLA